MIKTYKKNALIKYDGGHFYLPDKLKLDIDIFIDDMLDSNMDMVIMVDGKEGTGKSRTGRVIGKYISTITKVPFNHNNVHFDIDDYIKFSESKPKHIVNILDESRQALNKRRGMSKSNVKFTNWLSENRDKEQIHIIILPAIHDIDSYISIWRMSLLIHHLKGHIRNRGTRSGYKLVRGYFKVYENSKNLQQVIFNKSKYGYYAYPKDYKYQRKMMDHEVFSTVELDKYNEKKAKKRKEKYDDENISNNPFKKHLLKMIDTLRTEGKSQREIGEMANISKDYVRILENQSKEMTIKE